MTEGADLIAAALGISRDELLRVVVRREIERLLDMTPDQIRFYLWPTPPDRHHPRRTFPAAIECGHCRVIFTPLREATLFCCAWCMRVAGYRRRFRPKTRRSPVVVDLEVRRLSNNLRAKNYRRRKRAFAADFRETEARWSREYRRRKREAG